MPGRRVGVALDAGYFSLDGWDDVVDGGGRATEYPSMGVLKLRLPSPSCLLRFGPLQSLLSIDSDIAVGVTCTFPFPCSFPPVAAGCITHTADALCFCVTFYSVPALFLLCQSRRLVDWSTRTHKST